MLFTHTHHHAVTLLHTNFYCKTIQKQGCKNPAIRFFVTVHTPPLPLGNSDGTDLRPWTLSSEAFSVFPPSPAAGRKDTVSWGHDDM